MTTQTITQALKELRSRFAYSTDEEYSRKYARTDIPSLLDALELAVKHIDNLEAHIKAGRFSTLAQKVHSDGTLHAIEQRLTQKEK